MATIYLYTNLNMHNASVYYGTVLEATASEIAISNGVDQTIYLGNFTYDASGAVHGTLNTIYSYVNSNVAWIADDLNMNASVAYEDIQVLGNAQAFLQAALAGDDQFVIGAIGTHLIDGYGGNNSLTEIGPRSSYNLTVGSGAPGGTGEQDTFYNIQTVNFLDGYVDWTTGMFHPNGGDADWIMLQNSSGPLAGWQMSGATVVGGGLIGSNPGPTWHVEGRGHFLFGDGSTDVLWQNDNGSVAVWGVDSITVTGGAVVGNPGPKWHVEGAANFYGGVYSDIVFQNDNGSVAIWDMNGLSVVGGGLVGNPGPTWHVEGTGKFFSDGNTAILFQNDDGSVALWDMSGTNVVGGGLVITNPGPTWHIKGTGDFVGDGHADILWQNDNGSVAVWEMSGLDVIGGGMVSAVNPGPTWHIKATGDYNGDGRTDIAFQNDNGTVAVWDMNGTNIVGAGIASNPGPTWQVYDDNMRFIYSAAANETLAATPATPDEFVFTSFAAGPHTIGGFNPMQDMIELSKVQFASFAAVEAATTATAGGALINLGDGSSLLLAGVTPASLHASDFALA